MIKMAKGPTYDSKTGLSSQLTTDPVGQANSDLTGVAPALSSSEKSFEETSESPETRSEQTERTKKARLKYNETSHEIVINLGDVVDWNVLTADAREILKGFDDNRNNSKPEDKQKILMSLCTLFGWPTSVIASSKSPTEDEVQAERSDVEAALDRFDSLDRPEISSSQRQIGEDEDDE